MKPIEIYQETSEFCKLKLVMGLLMTLLTTVLYIVMVGLTTLASPILSYIMIPFWLILSYFLCRKIYRSVGWLSDAGHIAILTGLITTGRIPKNAVVFSSDMAKQRFHSRRGYIAVKHLIDDAVFELNTVFLKASSLVGEFPGIKMMVAIGRACLRVHLKYMTACILGYTYFRGDEGLYVSAAEGCAIFSINWKQLTKRAADITVSVMVAMLVITTALGIGLYMLIGVCGLTEFRYFGILLSAMLVLTFKHAYLDSWYTAQFLNQYMHLAEYSHPSAEFFHRLCENSDSFRRMRDLADGQLPTPKTGHTFVMHKKKRHAVRPQRMPDAAHPLICPRCRTANRASAKFCTGCGAKLK